MRRLVLTGNTAMKGLMNLTGTDFSAKTIAVLSILAIAWDGSMRQELTKKDDVLGDHLLYSQLSIYSCSTEVLVPA